MDEESGMDLRKAYACVIQSLVVRSEDKESHSSLSLFHSTRIPSISIDDYVERIEKYFQCSAECFVVSLAYIDRLLDHSNFVFNSYSVHRVVLVTVMEAAKFFDDSFFNNELYAKVGGISNDELNGLELEFVLRVNFSLHVSPSEYLAFHDELYKHCHEICTRCHDLQFPPVIYHPSTFGDGFLFYDVR